MEEANMELQDILFYIENADDTDMSEIVKAAVRRNDWLYPELETVFLTIPRKEPERKRALASATELLRKENRL